MAQSSVVVIDNGTGFMKAGKAGEAYPSVRFASHVGRPKHARVMAGGLDLRVQAGPETEKHRGLLSLKYPMRNGIVHDWEDMSAVWDETFAKLGVDSADCPVLLTEAALTPTQQRIKAAEIFLEKFKCPAICVCTQAVLSLYASGRTTGMVLDVGDGVSHVVPVVEGYAVQSAIKRSDVAGRDVTEALALGLRRAGMAFTSSADMEIVREIKEKHSEVASKARLSMLSQSQDTGSRMYTLPDGSEIKVGSERYMCSELLFNPSRIGKEDDGLHELLINSLQSCDMDLRPTLLQNIICAGGTTKTTGFGVRLLAELKAGLPQKAPIKLTTPPERQYTAWIGGSVLASLSSFSDMWVSKEQFAEDPNCLFKKSL